MGRKAIPMEGRTFGRLTVIERAGKDSKGVIKYRCKCECGKVIETKGTLLRNGNTKSCGCYQIEQTRKAATTHGQTHSRLYRIWRGMRARCGNPNHKYYKDYGGRGIKVCSEWSRFTSFYEWSLKVGYENNLTLDRVNNNSNYSPKNCRWTTQQVQLNNTRVNRRVVIDGKSYTLAELARRTGLNYWTLKQRLNHGWSVEKLLTPPTIVRGNK